MRMRIFAGLLVALVLVALAVPPERAVAQKKGKGSGKETYTGTAVAIGGQFGGRSRPFTLIIESYTPDAELQQALGTLREGGQDELMKAIGKKKLGSFALDGQVGRDLNLVMENDTGEGRKITILFERWLQMFEVRYGTRSQDYPFTYIELFVDEKGKGEGSLIGAAKVYFDKKNPGNLDIENFGTYPARLMGVQLRK